MKIGRREITLPSNFSIEHARRAQRLLAAKVIEEDDLPEKIHIIVGCDVAYRRNMAYAAAVALDFNTLTVIRHAIKRMRINFPYIPTLLAFREAAPMIAAIKMLKIKPDVIFIDGQGRAHPFRLGIASHIGVVLNVPSIGIAKKKLCGRIGEFQGDYAFIYDNNEIIGAAVKTKEGCNPIFVSIGHKVSLETAIKLVLRTCHGYKLPEPIRIAHSIATKEARKR